MRHFKRRKKRVVLCRHCHEEFETYATNAVYCKKKPCQIAKNAYYQKQARLYGKYRNRQYKKIAPENKHRKCQFMIITRKGIEKPCGRDTGKNYFFCTTHHNLVDDYGMNGTL